MIVLALRSLVAFTTDVNPLRRRLLELAATVESFVSPHKSRAQEVDRCTLLDVGPGGELSVNFGRIDPSLATPKIFLSKCIASVRRSENGEDFEGELEVEGVVRSALCDSIASGTAVFTQVVFRISEDMKFEERFIEVHGKRTRADDILRPFPFEGRFSAVLKGIPVTGGKNAFYFRARDPVSDLTAETVWSASFFLPYDDEQDEEEDDESLPSAQPTRLEPTVTSAAVEIQSASGLDPVFYCLGVQGAKGDLEVAFGQAGEEWYPLRASPTLSDLIVPIDPVTDRPLLFTLVPGGPGRARDYWDHLSKRKDFIPLEGRERFLAAFYQGMLSNGITLSAGGTSHVEVLSFCEESGRCEFPIRIRCDRKIREAALPLPPKFKGNGMGDRKRFGDLVWIWREMAVRKDPKLSDFEMGVVYRDLTSVGIENTCFQGWASEFTLLAVEAIRATIKEGLDFPDPGQAGYLIGAERGQASIIDRLT